MDTLKRKAMDGPSADHASPLKAPRAEAPPTPAPVATVAAAEPVACVHEVSYPEGYDPSDPTSRVLAGGGEGSEPAKTFPFELDPFQTEAIRCLDNGESVMVSAHTSAGKTVVASYAIAMSLRNQQRVIYTSPIKALSNQKYREFKSEFSDVGLMTGDVTIEPNASCLVMTTEIWRSMQYKGSEVMREVAWIIFDEVHYMRDRERGVVWEESIVMAPKNSRFVFLSATVPNAKEFADWVAKHYVFPSGGDGLYLVVDEKGKFREDSFQKALNALIPAGDSDKKKENGKWQKAIIAGKPSEDSDIFKMVKMIIQRKFLRFSDHNVWYLLPIVSNMLPLLKRGIGVHHSGLLPILKEVIEILFQEGYIKADRALPDLEKQIKELELERNSMVIEEEESLKDYYDLLQQYKSLKKDVHDIVLSPKYVLPFLQPGRLVRILYSTNESTTFSIDENVTWGVIINFEKVKSHGEDRRPEDSDYTVDVLTRCSVKARENTLRKVEEVLSRFAKDGVPLLDPEEDMKVQSKSFRKATRRIEALEGLFEKHDIRNSPHIQQRLKVLHAKQELSAKIKSIKKTMRSSTALAFKDELKARKRVLRRLGYVTSDDVVEVKGKVACEISTADELTLTELMFSGGLKDATVEQMVALLSCFVWQEKLQDAPKPREELDLLFYQLQETARRVANLQHECKIQIDVESFVNSFRPDIMEAVYSWARGSKFYQIMEMTQVFEGSLIRAIRRLEEVLQQLILASKSIGETELEAKLEEAVSKIKRDIVFAASLYL
ncbi:hypothetical protein PR202_ga07712 [Eleusine coracana subsp. coracana]|uniref:Helicase ATP-binding domain-containing protein n=1 Tax=Eleusine coracana subsp. coracana TaxID=191504 RepID=A0AAV5BY77_ELECO|nr:hypothetical protein PR202_ga07712 [Eleusine coracana subsp. coracana]